MFLALIYCFILCHKVMSTPICPTNYAMVNNICQPIQNYGTSNNINSPISPSCPDGYFFINGLCYVKTTQENSLVTSPETVLQPCTNFGHEKNFDSCLKSCLTNNLQCSEICQQISLQPCIPSFCSQNSGLDQCKPTCRPPNNIPICQQSMTPCASSNFPQNLTPCQPTMCSSQFSQDTQIINQCKTATGQPNVLNCQSSPCSSYSFCQQNQQLSPIYPTYPPIRPVYPCITTVTPPVTIPPAIETKPSTITTTPPSTAPPAPVPITKCPENTILLNGKCRVIYCGRGIYRNGRCVQTVCPEGTVWNGNKCDVPETIVHDVKYNRTTINNYSFNAPNIVVTNSETVNVNATVHLPSSFANNSISDPKETSCCTVKTPRICKKISNDGRWNCYTKSQRMCGGFCTTPTINLSPPRPQYIQPYLVMPPNPIAVNIPNLITFQNPYDCSTCMKGFPYNCPQFCNKYDCSQPNCQFYDQKTFCNSNPGQFGCIYDDGCFDDWCEN